MFYVVHICRRRKLATADGFRSAGNEEDVGSDVDAEEAEGEAAGKYQP